jgi:chromosome segregation ATPase
MANISNAIKDLQALEAREKQADEVFAKAQKIQSEAYQMKSDAEAELSRAKAIKQEYAEVSFKTDKRLKEREEKVATREAKVAKLEAEFGTKVADRNNAIAKKESELKAETARLEVLRRSLQEGHEKLSANLDAFGKLHSSVQEFNKAIK